MQKLIFTNEVARELSGLIAAANPHGVYVLADSNTVTTQSLEKFLYFLF